MTRKLPPRRSPCPIACALDLIGDRWTLIVLRDLIFVRKRHFRELLEGHEGIATNILASRLKMLEGAGLVSRRADPAEARRVIYAPTEKALDLLPVLLELTSWSLKHNAGTDAPAHIVRRLGRDREGLIADVRAAHSRP